MPERPHRALAEHIVDHLSANGKDALFRNGDLPGLGIRVYSAGREVYVAQTRSNGRSIRATVGRHGDIAPDEARKDAAKLLAHIKAGLPLVEPEPRPAPSATSASTPRCTARPTPSNMTA